MNRFIVRYALLPLACIAFCITLPGFTKPGGVESYQIYLNNKLLVQQYMTKPLQLENLQLDNSNSRDVLVIYYNHCGAVGTGRSISARDAQGKVLKEWQFADPQGPNTGMIIPVGELLALQKINSRVSLYYNSRSFPGARMLTSLTLGAGTSAKFASKQ